jgi:hypothetical protein
MFSNSSLFLVAKYFSMHLCFGSEKEVATFNNNIGLGRDFINLVTSFV